MRQRKRSQALAWGFVCQVLQEKSENCRQFTHFQLADSWYAQPTPSKIRDQARKLPWKEAAVNWWKMSSFISPAAVATKKGQTKAKAKGLNMSSLKSVTKLPKLSLSVPHPRKQLPLSTYLLFRTRCCAIKLLKDIESSILPKTSFPCNCKSCVRCSHKSQLKISCAAKTIQLSYRCFHRCLVVQVNYPANNTVEFCLRAWILVEYTGAAQLQCCKPWKTLKGRTHSNFSKYFRKRHTGKGLLCAFWKLGTCRIVAFYARWILERAQI